VEEKLTVFDVVDRLETQDWDKIERFWIPADKDSGKSVIYANKKVGDYGLHLVILGIGEDGCFAIKLRLVKNLSFGYVAGNFLIYKEDLEQTPEIIMSNLDKVADVLGEFERKCPKEHSEISLEELANMLGMELVPGKMDTE
jgi:hypothetical protein